jgi:hypothetical protein
MPIGKVWIHPPSRPTASTMRGSFASRINTDARPIALQVALLIPILAGLARALQRVAHGSPAGPGPGRVGRSGGAGLTVVRDGGARAPGGTPGGPIAAAATRRRG